LKRSGRLLGDDLIQTTTATGQVVERLATLDERSRSEVEIYACGPMAMLAATARLAREFDLPCQVALEELMACATGGCAGCAVRVQTPDGPAMKKVCVEGPVFDAAQVF